MRRLLQALDRATSTAAVVGAVFLGSALGLVALAVVDFVFGMARALRMLP